MRVQSSNHTYLGLFHLGKAQAGKAWVNDGNEDIRSLSTEVTGGFVGCTIGIYAIAETPCRQNREAGMEKQNRI